MIVLAVTWKSHAGRETEVVEVFRKLTEESRREPGCLMYQVHQHKDEPRLILVYEQYKDEAALEAHRNSPHFQEYARKQLPTLGERIEGNLYRPI